MLLPSVHENAVVIELLHVREGGQVGRRLPDVLEDESTGNGGQRMLESVAQ